MQRRNILKALSAVIAAVPSTTGAQALRVIESGTSQQQPLPLRL